MHRGRNPLLQGNELFFFSPLLPSLSCLPLVTSPQHSSGAGKGVNLSQLTASVCFLYCTFYVFFNQKKSCKKKIQIIFLCARSTASICCLTPSLPAQLHQRAERHCDLQPAGSFLLFFSTSPHLPRRKKPKHRGLLCQSKLRFPFTTPPPSPDSLLARGSQEATVNFIFKQTSQGVSQMGFIMWSIQLEWMGIVFPPAPAYPDARQHHQQKRLMPY